MTEQSEIIERLKSAGTLLKQRDYQGALTAFQRILHLDRNCADAYAGCAYSCRGLGEKSSALKNILSALELNPDHLLTRGLFLDILAEIELKTHTPVVVDELIKCLDIKDIAAPSIIAPALLQLRDKHQPDSIDHNARSEPDEKFRALLLDPLLLGMLSDSLIPDMQIELLMTRARCFLLFHPDAQIFSDNQRRTLSLQLSLQGYRNYYIYHYDDDEAKLLQTREVLISNLLVSRTKPDRMLENALLIWLMYKPLDSHPERARLAEFAPHDWSADIAPLIKKTLTDRVNEQVIRENLASLGTVSNDVSRKVKIQYEDFPYPHWQSLSGRLLNMPQRLERALPGFGQPSYLHSEMDILVAGAGTGQHPIDVAMASPKARVTAVDLSGSSLAYGIRMARELGVENIDFVQGDLLDVGSLGKRFHVVECAGVLHHMADPLEGWRRLTNVLREDGLMKIALYSETARQSVIRAREQIAELGIQGTAGDIRNFRYRLMGNLKVGGHPDLMGITTFLDFYSLPMCKDLVFNVQEIRFSIDGIESALDSLNLSFLGMEGSPPRQSLLNLQQRGIIKGSLRLDDLALWKQVEQHNPSTFTGMYQFWCKFRH